MKRIAFGRLIAFTIFPLCIEYSFSFFLDTLFWDFIQTLSMEENALDMLKTPTLQLPIYIFKLLRLINKMDYIAVVSRDQVWLFFFLKAICSRLISQGREDTSRSCSFKLYRQSLQCRVNLNYLSSNYSSHVSLALRESRHTAKEYSSCCVCTGPVLVCVALGVPDVPPMILSTTVNWVTI